MTDPIPQDDLVARLFAEKVARMLTGSQKRLLLALDAVEYRDWKALSDNVRTRNRLAALDLAHFDDTRSVQCYFMRRLSPLGREVCAVLERSAPIPSSREG